MSHIFVSYSKKDIGFARHLKWLLEAHGFRVWMDEKSIDPSDDWWQTIEASVVNCVAFTVIMSENARQSRWVRREVLLAENLGKPMFPVLLDGQVWAQLADIQSADMRGGTREELPEAFLRALQTAFEHRNIPITPTGQRKRKTGRRLAITFGLAMIALIAVALVLINNPFSEGRITPTFDPVREAERLLTETEVARIAFLTTPNYTQTVESILNRFLTETQTAGGNVPTTPTAVETEEAGLTETIVGSPSPTELLTDTPESTLNAVEGTQIAATLLQSAREEQETLEASCPGSPSPSRLTIGMVGRVTEGGLPSRLRTEPTTNAEYLVNIPSLGQFIVVAGPACDEQQLRWWQVDYQGNIGWVAEGVGEEYYLEPAPA